MKKGKLSNKEKFLIQNLFVAGVDIPEIAENLERSEKVVSKYMAETQHSLNKIKANKAEAEVEEVEEQPEVLVEVDDQGNITETELMTQKQMRTAMGIENGRHGITVMQPNASEAMDDKKKARGRGAIVNNRITKTSIFKMDPKKSHG